MGVQSMTELRVNRQDVEIEWLDEHGWDRAAPGCRITHIDSGLHAACSMFPNREANRRDALYVLATRMLSLNADRVILEGIGPEQIVAE